jgi:hypothetical protein
LFRGVAMFNPIDHPLVVEKVKVVIGRPSVSPWGILTKRFLENSFIVL